jgi:hypothetical protein
MLFGNQRYWRPDASSRIVHGGWSAIRHNASKARRSEGDRHARAQNRTISWTTLRLAASDVGAIQIASLECLRRSHLPAEVVRLGFVAQRSRAFAANGFAPTALTRSFAVGRAWTTTAGPTPRPCSPSTDWRCARSFARGKLRIYLGAAPRPRRCCARRTLTCWWRDKARRGRPAGAGNHSSISSFGRSTTSKSISSSSVEPPRQD